MDPKLSATYEDERSVLLSRSIGFWAASAIFILLAVVFSPCIALADEGGVSFWLPGLFGSLIATPAQPGWSFAAINYYTSPSASGPAAAEREITIGKLNPTVKVDLNVNLHANADLVLVNPTYVFATPVLGGQLAVGLMGIVGRNSIDLDGTITAGIGPFTITKSGSITDAVTGVGDLYPQMLLRWNSGVNNFMTYVTGDIPVGDYDSSRLANIGIGHGAVDAGAGYTYFDQKYEFSLVSGLTYNCENPSTNYHNGIDWHLDWGASQFLSKQVFVGAVGYFYDQFTADRGSLPSFGAVESRVVGVGPQVGFIFPAGSVQTFLGLKGYFEFDSHDRPSGWNAWVSLSFSPSAAMSAAAPPILTKAR